MTDSTPGPQGAVAAIEVHVPAQTDELSGLRRIVREYIESAGGDRSTADDLELVASELATNVIEHTVSPTITLTIERTSDAWMIEVSDVDHPFALADVAVLPAASERAGRGLFVVRSLVDDLQVVETPTSRALRCRRPLNR
jgi:anti-sigma regulatory factor (Ser/Thr protein kinase)